MHACSEHVDCLVCQNFLSSQNELPLIVITFESLIILNNVQSLVKFEAEYETRGREGGYNTITHGIRLYDGLWALAFALNRTMAMVNSGDINGTTCQNASGSLVPLHQFTYSNELMGCLIQWSLQVTNFSGLTVS